MISYSPDGSSRWSTPVFDSALFEPVCMASMIKLQATNALLFVNPDSEHLASTKPGPGKARKNLTARLSYDEGKNWSVEKVLETGNAGYSDLAVAPDGTIYCLYETNNESEGWRYKIVVRSFNQKWLSTEVKK
jgi:sialidase-1